MKSPDHQLDSLDNPVLVGVLNGVGLLKNSDGSFRLDEDRHRFDIGETLELDRLFDQHAVIGPEGVLRPEGGTTIFTTAGVQHVETLESQGIFSRQTFQVAQPVVRSQYMDKIVEGFSTSFINYSIVSTHSSLEEFIQQLRKLIRFSLQKDPDPSHYRLTFEEVEDRWGQKKFKKNVFTIMYKGIEITEGVLMENYPLQDGSTISISDICFGEERVNWAYGFEENRRYFSGFDSYYDISDPDVIARLIDPILTATLMTALGVEPNHKDPGFRLRQLIKRFFERNLEFKLSSRNLSRIAFSIWSSKKIALKYNEEKVLGVLAKEYERCRNVYITSEIERRTQTRIRVDVNISTVEFLERIRMSCTKDIVDTANAIDQQINGN